MKILVAVDGSPCSRAAVDEVCRRPWPPGTEVRLLTVESPVDASPLRGLTTVYDELRAQQRVESEQRLDAAARVFERDAPGLPVLPVLREGWPKEVILDEAEQWGADLIVVGSQGAGVFRRFFLGSVSLAVATHASCSVEIVRAVPEKSPEES